MSERAMMSDSRYRVTKADPWRFGEIDQDRSKATAEARRILAETESPRHQHTYYGPAALRLCGEPFWSPRLEPTRQAAKSLAESLAAFVGADDPAAYLAGVAR